MKLNEISAYMIKKRKGLMSKRERHEQDTWIHAGAHPREIKEFEIHT